ncbi:unnamed protein product [Rotaria sordida]|uniref:PPIase cyclophilin-type domain-containing protein n=1 Tax=Rotaria sordida TaxID=392033 RepID=A0A813UQN3_9BILA|nr:unnamed protein product [Rotaria sordida]
MCEKGSNNWIPVQTYEFRVAVINDVELGIPSKPSKAQKTEVPMYPADTLDQPKTEVTELPARDHSCTILNLKEDDEVSFHVQPLNVVHPSESSRPTDVVIIEDHMGTHSSSFIINLQIEVGNDFYSYFSLLLLLLIDFIGGDIQNFDGSGGESIFGKTFADENFNNKHNKSGLLSMVNFGPNTNGSQFFISSIALPYFDDTYVVLGEVISGMDVINAIMNYDIVIKVGQDFQLHISYKNYARKAQAQSLIDNTEKLVNDDRVNVKKDNDDNNIKYYVVESCETEKWTKVGSSISDRTYDIRVTENGNGISESLVVDASIKAKWPFKPRIASSTSKCARHTIPNLVDGKEYEFHVAAVNKASPREYAKTDELIQKRSPDVVSHAVDYSSALQVIFAKDSDDIKPDGNIQVIVKDGVAELLVPKMNGPLDVTDVKPDSCVLTWKVPKKKWW